MDQNQKAGIGQDLDVLRAESALYRRFPRKRLEQMLESPQNCEQDIRELSGYLYLVSPCYRRLVDYLSIILKYHYTIRPTRLPVPNPLPADFMTEYYAVANACEKYCLPREAAKAMKIAIRDGVFYGLCFESEDSFYIRPFDPLYARITGVNGGVYRFCVNLDYFTENPKMLLDYGDNFMEAYLLYKGETPKEDGKPGITGNPDYQWFEPQNGICLKADESDLSCSLPLFTGLLLSAFDMEDYKLLQKVRKVNDSYKVLSAKLETDEEGVPKMSFPTAKQYYDQIAGSLPDSVGLLLTPFTISEVPLERSPSAGADKNPMSEKIPWFPADESVAFSILRQFEEYFNKKIRDFSLVYGFQLKFTDQSVFNSDQFTSRLAQAVQNGLPFQMDYAVSLGVSPSDFGGMAERG